MIDAKLIAKAFFDEARLLSDATRGASPDLEQRWREDLELSPLPSPDHLATVIEEMFWASLTNDEGRPSRPRLIHFPDIDYPATIHPFHAFQEPIPLERNALRKLAPAAGDRGYLIWCAVEGVPKLVGIRAPLPVGVEQIRTIADSSGSGAIDLWRHARLVLLRDGKVLRLSTHRNAGTGAVFSQLYFHSRSPEGAYGFQPVLQEILQHQHGGSIWFVPDGHSLDSLRTNNVKVDRPLAFDLRSPSERFPDDQNWVQWLRSIGSLAATDGGVLVDSKMRLLGFGAFIPTPDQVLVRLRTPSGDGDVVDASTLGGARHRAAAQFCSQFGAASAAMVVSQDGRISILSRPDDSSMPVCTEVVDLGFRRDTF